MREDKCRRDRFEVLGSAFMPAGEHSMPYNGSLQLKELFVHTKGGKMFLSEEAFSIYTEGLQTDVKKYIFVSILCFPCNHDPNRKVRDSWSCTQRTYRDRSIHLNTYLFKCQEASTLELFPSEYSQQNKQQAALQTGSKDDMWLDQSNQNH